MPITSEYYIAASEEVKAHTKYFIDKGYTKKKTPPNRVTANAFVSPFHSPDGKIRQKVKRLDSDGSGSSKDPDTASSPFPMLSMLTMMMMMRMMYLLKK